METILVLSLLISLFYLLQREIRHNLTEKSFISIVNHTFRTPLTRIKWMSDSLKEDTPRKEQLEAAHELSNSVDRLLEIVDILAGIKDVQNSSAYNLKAVSLREILEHAISKYRTAINEKKISLRVPTLIHIPFMSIDTKKISLVIDIILENAILYSKEGGMVTIESEVKNNTLILTIEDAGIGLSWKDKNNIFGRFYRGDRAKKMNTDGMGLGLYISKIIIHRHHGDIYARSKGKDKGTTLYILLPIDK